MEKEEVKKEIIMVHEGLVESILKDIVSYGVIISFLYVNYKYLGDHILVAVVIMIILIFISVGKASKQIKHFHNKKDAIDYVNSLDIK